MVFKSMHAMERRSRQRILVVEDDQDVREFLGEILADEGYALEFASEGQQGLDSFKSGAYCLVLTDLLMPSLHGMDLIKAIRGDGHTVPIIAISGYPTVSDDVIDRGANAFFVKPFDNDELTHKISELLSAA